MKRITTILVLTILICGCTGKRKGWSATEKDKFMIDCNHSAIAGDTKNRSKKSFCSCMQGTLEAMYPDYSRVDKINIESPRIVKMIKKCSEYPWTSEERKNSIDSCIEAAKAEYGQKKATSYCTCMQARLEVKYKSYGETTRLTQDDLYEFINAFASDCMKSDWSASDREKFISECIKTAKPGMEEEKAKDYCTCMQGKFENKYTSYKEANKITEEDLKTPEMQSLMEDCLKIGQSSYDENFISSRTKRKW